MAGAGYSPERRVNWWRLALIVGLHVLAVIGLARVFAPDLTRAVIAEASSLVTVTVRTWEEPQATPSPDPSAQPDEGAAAEAGREAEARAVVAPEAPLPRPSAAPRAASTGTANSAGARDQGDGTGAGGSGDGTGSGRAGSGRGGLPVSGPTVRSGRIDAARDFPIPEGGRRMREGTSVTVQFTVGVDGRASDCSISAPGPDPATNALVCPLVIERIRFNPARDAAGNAVAARYGWRQDFFRR